MTSAISGAYNMEKMAQIVSKKCNQNALFPILKASSLPGHVTLKFFYAIRECQFEQYVLIDSVNIPVYVSCTISSSFMSFL